MHFYDSIFPVASHYDGFIIDLWGVIHDGSALYPGVKETLATLKDAKKKILFLSNAPRRAAEVIAVLKELGITEQMYDHVLSSGEVAYAMLSAMPPKRLYYIGLPKDEHIMHGLIHPRVERVEDAEIFLISGFTSFTQPMSEVEPVLQAAQAKNIPALCINPDREVVKITGERFLCGGAIAEAYEERGGEVGYIGKPYSQVYEQALALLGLPARKVLAIGDNLFTDILGAELAGIPSLLIAGGVLKEELALTDATLHHIHPLAREKIKHYCSEYDIMPDMVTGMLT